MVARGVGNEEMKERGRVWRERQKGTKEEEREKEGRD